MYRIKVYTVQSSYSSQSVSFKPSSPSGLHSWLQNTTWAVTSLHASHFAKRLRNSFLVSLSCSKRSSLTIFQFFSYYKSTAVMSRGDMSLRSVTIADFKMIKPQRLSHTGLRVSPFQWSPQGFRLRILLQVVEAWWRAHCEYILFLISNSTLML